MISQKQISGRDCTTSCFIISHLSLKYADPFCPVIYFKLVVSIQCAYAIKSPIF